MRLVPIKFLSFLGRTNFHPFIVVGRVTCIHNFVSEVSLVHDLLLRSLPQLEVLSLHLAHLTPLPIHLKLDPLHLVVGVFQLVLHLLHLPSLLLQSLTVLDKLLMDLGSWLSCQNILQLQKQFLLLSNQVLLLLHLFSLGDEPSLKSLNLENSLVVFLISGFQLSPSVNIHWVS